TIVYTHSEGTRAPVGIAVEGVTDVWRLGTSAFATFGTEYKVEQILAIARLHRRVAVAFDPERAAQDRARRLAARLRAAGVEAEVIRPPGGSDPGDMAEDDARHFVREITRWGNAA